jgi:hypothetical protein
MNDQQTFQRAIDDLDTGLDRGPDLASIHQVGLRGRRRRRITQGVGLAAVVATVGAVALVPSGRWGGPASHTEPPIATGPSSGSGLTPTHPKLAQPTVVEASLPTGQLNSEAPAVPGGLYVALNDLGWQVSYVQQSYGEIDVSYRKSEEQLDITQYPADQYSSYYHDRDDLGDRQAVSLLGQDATMWAYGPDDHTTIRTVQNDHFLEVRGTGMDLPGFETLLDQVVQTDQAGFAQSLPDDVVTPVNREQAVQHLLQGVDTPPGFSQADVQLQGFNDAYQSAAEVAGAVGCAWINVYDGGSAADRNATVAAFEGSRQWPLLLAIEDQGAYAQGFWSVATQLVNGFDKDTTLADLKQSICS